MVFGKELGEERCRSENGEARTARRTNSLCTSAAMRADVTNTRVEPRMPKGPKWNPRSPEPEHVASRIAAAEAKDRDLGVFARMAVAIGACRGELVVLRWSAIDFE